MNDVLQPGMILPIGEVLLAVSLFYGMWECRTSDLRVTHGAVRKCSENPSRGDGGRRR